MEFINGLIAYFKNDPMRILSLVGGSGGLVYWVDRYLNRTRLKVKIMDLGLHKKPGEPQSTLVFEAENLGTKPTSLNSQIILYGFVPKSVQRGTAKKIKRKKYTFHIESSDRTLQPNVPKVIKAKADIDSMTPFLWFMSYIITPTRGNTCKVRVRSASKTELNFFQYLLELSGYILFNYLSIKDT